MQKPDAHENRSRKKQTLARLSAKLEKNLWTYAAAASAAGVGILASPQAAEAKIVYTPVNATLHVGYAIDLNHDGIVDFNVIPWGSASVAGSTQRRFLDVCHKVEDLDSSENCVSSTFAANADNVVLAAGKDAAALAAGATIGNGQPFIGTGAAVYMGGRVFYSVSNRTKDWNGPWVNGGEGVTNRYLGLKFKIDGEYHYGWARVTVQTTSKGFLATLTGYAYETVANKSILAGQTTEVAEAGGVNSSGAIVAANASSGAASLGMLALGAEGLAVWRREEVDRVEPTAGSSN
jgi:hypothetical protein